MCAIDHDRMIAASKLRKERLAALRAKKAAANGGQLSGKKNLSRALSGSPDDTAGRGPASRKRQRLADSSSSSPRLVKFRNYVPKSKPVSAKETSSIEPPSETLSKRVAGAVAAATNPRDAAAPIVIVQKKIDWDLKRDVAPQLNILETRTQIAIRELLRHQLAKSSQ